MNGFTVDNFSIITYHENSHENRHNLLIGLDNHFQPFGRFSCFGYRSAVSLTTDHRASATANPNAYRLIANQEDDMSINTLISSGISVTVHNSPQVTRVTTECPRCAGTGEVTGTRTAVDWYETETCPDCDKGQITVPAEVLEAVELSKHLQQLEDQKADAFWRVKILQPLGEGVYGCQPSPAMLNEASGTMLACRMSMLVPEARLRCIEFQYPDWAEYIERHAIPAEDWREMEKVAARLRIKAAMERGKSAFGMDDEAAATPAAVSAGESTSDPAAELNADNASVRYAGAWL